MGIMYVDEKQQSNMTLKAGSTDLPILPVILTYQSGTPSEAL